MATALVTAGITELPAVVNIVKSIIGLFNHSKKAPLTPDQATATAAAATAVAKTTLQTAASNGVISPASIPPDAQLQALIQQLYILEGAGVKISTSDPAGMAANVPTSGGAVSLHQLATTFVALDKALNGTA